MPHSIAFDESYPMVTTSGSDRDNPKDQQQPKQPDSLVGFRLGSGAAAPQPAPKLQGTKMLWLLVIASVQSTLSSEYNLFTSTTDFPSLVDDYKQTRGRTLLSIMPGVARGHPHPGQSAQSVNYTMQESRGDTRTLNITSITQESRGDTRTLKLDHADGKDAIRQESRGDTRTLDTRTTTGNLRGQAVPDPGPFRKLTQDVVAVTRARKSQKTATTQIDERGTTHPRLSIWGMLSMILVKPLSMVTPKKFQLWKLLLLLHVLFLAAPMYLVMHMMHQDGTSTRGPPWNPRGTIRFHQWILEVQAWLNVTSTRMSSSQQAAAIQLGLQGIARDYAISIPAQAIAYGAAINGVHSDPVTYVLYCVGNRFSELEEERMMQA